MNFGVQTFTIRNAQKKDIFAAYLPLVDMGVTILEIARIDFNEDNADKIKAITEKYGIRPVSIQVKPKYVFGDPDAIVRFCKTTGCKNVVISQLPFDCILGREERFYRFLDSLDAQFELYARQGITLAYHHHNWEYVKLSNGRTIMEELLTRTSKIRFVHDTYWTARCGIDPSDQIRIFGDRLLGIHLRDITFRKKLIDVIPRDTFIGDGVIDFRKVLSAAETTGCEYTVIEQRTKTPYDDIKRSLENLKKIRSCQYE